MSASGMQNKPAIDKRYQVLELLGEGGTSTVYKARHLLMDKIVAIKVLKLQLAADDVWLSRFKKEAQSATVLKHPNIIDIQAYGVTDEGSPYMVMEFIDGMSLQSVLKTQGRLKTERAIRLFGQICAGLSQAHHHKMVHRDLKPANVMIAQPGENEQAVILDFGLVKETGQNETQQALTRGAPIGTASYMSPEQCASKEITPASDIYASACLLYEMLVGKPLFEGNSPLEIMYKQINDMPALAELPAGFSRVITQALQKDPTKRYASIDEFNDDVLSCKNELVTSAQIAQGQSGQVSGRQRRSAVRTAVFSLAAALLLSASAFMLLSHSPNSSTPSTFSGMTIDELMAKGLKETDLEDGHTPNYQLALKYFEMAGKAADSGATYSRGNGSVYFRIGLCYTQLRQYKTAISPLKRAHELLTSTSEDGLEERTQSLYQLAVAYITTGQTQQAEAVLEELLTIHEKRGPSLGYGWALSLYAQCLAADKNLTKFRVYYQKAFDTMRTSEVRNHEPSSIVDREFIQALINQRQFDEAGARLAKMRARLESESTPGETADHLYEIARSYWDCGKPDDGLRCMKIAYQESKSAPEKDRIVAIGTMLQAWLDQGGRHAEAAKIDAEIRPLRKDLQGANDSRNNHP
jgi:serine/threonine protein kinase